MEKSALFFAIAMAVFIYSCYVSASGRSSSAKDEDAKDDKIVKK